VKAIVYHTYGSPDTIFYLEEGYAQWKVVIVVE